MKTKLGQFLFYCSAGILLIWLVTFFSSCISEKKRQEICRTCALKIETKTRDSIGEPTVKKSKYDSLVNVANRAGRTFKYKNCDSLMKALHQSPDSSISATENGVKGTISGKGGNLTFKCETDSLKAVIAMLRLEISRPHYRFIDKIVEVPARCELEHLSKWDSFFIITGRILWCILILSGIGWLIKRRFFPGK